MLGSCVGVTTDPRCQPSGRRLHCSLPLLKFPPGFLPTLTAAVTLSLTLTLLIPAPANHSGPGVQLGLAGVLGAHHTLPNSPPGTP